MGLQEVLEEVESLSAIFCRDGEFVLHSDTRCLQDEGNFSIEFSITVAIEEGHGIQEGCAAREEINHRPTEVVFTANVDENYPGRLEGFSLKSTGIDKRNLDALKGELHNYIEEILFNGEEISMMNIVNWIRENVRANYTPVIDAALHKNTEVDAKQRCVLLKLDHMRNKQKYTKLITGWMNELNMCGRVMFYKKLIWIIICGKADDAKEYMKRHKTRNVDVDSNGRPCKERMMNVILEKDVEICYEL